MNEQIKELMGKTLDKHFSHTWTVMDYEDVSKFAEKFAELIVQECVLEAMDAVHHNNSIRLQLYKHFGVE